MAAEEELPSVSKLFDKYLQLYEDVDNSDKPSNSEELQGQIKELISGLIKTTVLVSQIGVFSSNESILDIPTSNLKFLLLPVILGSISLKRIDLERGEVLRLAGIYFKDYLRRCKGYEIGKIDYESEEEEEEIEGEKIEEEKIEKRGMPSPEELQKMARQREQKIRRYREKKSIGDRLIELKKSIKNPSHDEETLRNFQILRIEKFIWLSIEELESINMEKKMLQEISKMKLSGKRLEDVPRSAPSPLKPILITRDAVQKNVFGLGYPSRPSMTVEEFYDQRVRDGWFPDPTKNNNCLQDRAVLGPDEEKESEEREEEEKEREIERDDEERLARDRERDEWRDDHRRGWGNTYNRS